MKKTSLGVMGLSLVANFVSAVEYPGGSKYQAMDQIQIKKHGPGSTPEEVAQAAASYVSESIRKNGKERKHKFSDILSRTEFDLYGSTKRKPRYGVRTIQPLYESLNKEHTVFTQVSLFNESRFGERRTTLNTGLGYRHMMLDEKLILGANAFYDYEWPFDHQRMSLGVEVKSSVFDINFQEYIGLSGHHSINEIFEEIPLGGRELEFGIPLPYLPGTKFYYRKYWWDKEDVGGGMRGERFSFEAKLPKGFTLEAGRWDDNKINKRNFIILRYALKFGVNKEEEFFSKNAFDLKSIEARRLERVRRSNTIMVDRQSKGGRLKVRVIKTG